MIGINNYNQLIDRKMKEMSIFDRKFKKLSSVFQRENEIYNGVTTRYD